MKIETRECRVDGEKSIALIFDYGINTIELNLATLKNCLDIKVQELQQDLKLKSPQYCADTTKSGSVHAIYYGDTTVMVHFVKK